MICHSLIKLHHSTGVMVRIQLGLVGEGATGEMAGLHWGIGGLGHIGGAVHPVGNRRPVLLGDRLDQLPQAFVLADGDGEADTHFAADGDESVGIEAAVGAHRDGTPHLRRRPR